MMTQEELNDQIRKLSKKQIVFFNTYLKTLDPRKAFQKAKYSMKNSNCIGVGMYKVYHKLLPLITAWMSLHPISITKDFIIVNWLSLLSQGDITAKQHALKQLSKLYKFTEQQIRLSTDSPINISFTSDNQ